MAQMINDINKQTLLRLTNFFETELQQGNVQPDPSPSIMANYLLNAQFGLAIAVTSGSFLQ